jgi:uroporphyrinogen-III decarboxylase
MANQILGMIHPILYGNGLRIGKLSGEGRVLATMLGAHADVVPFQGPQIHDHAMTVARVPARKYYFDAELLVDTQLAVERWYGFDTFSIIPDAYNFEVEALGAKFIYSDDAMPTVDTTDPLIKEPGDLDRIGSLDPTKGRIPMGVEVARLVCKKASGLFAAGFFCSPWSLICQAASYPRAVRALKRDRAFAQELFDWAENDAIFPYLKAQRQAGVKQSFGADAWAAFPNLTPALADEWVVPSARRLAARAKKELGMTASAGLASGDYCEEDPTKFDKKIMFDCWSVARKTMFINVAFSGMGRTQDWDMHWLNEFAVQEGKGKRKLPIFASLNGRFVRDSSPEQIVAKVREWIDIMGRDGRLLFFIANVPADTPPVNVHTAIQAVRTLGRYPIVADLMRVKVDLPKFEPFDQWLKGQPEAEGIFRAREEA